MSRRCYGCMELFGEEFDLCPHCGHIVGATAEEAIHMDPGSLLYDRYIVGKVLGYGGFGVTYIGWDGKLEQKVAIKEYLPGEFSTRMPGQSQVTVFNGEKSEQFYDGMRKFVDEAKRLAKFQNEAGIVKIFDSFEENETAYIVMEYLEGETLTEYLKREKTVPEERAIEMIVPVMESLNSVHEAGLLHRDIAPDNIFLLKNGEIKLIDFGASRYATTSHSRSLTVIIKPGFSPEEQYRSRGDQGPYTDVYALAATLYKMITGKTPPDAMERRAKYENQNKDILEEPHKINKKISPNTEVALLNAMNVRIEDRTPDIPTFLKELRSDPPAKRIYGKIKKLDLYAWPLWLKIAVPSVLAALLLFVTLLFTGVIRFSLFSEEIVIPEGIVTVPDVEGMYNNDAILEIEKNKLNAATSGNVESEYIPAGTIVLQDPMGGTYRNANSTVYLTVSSGNGVQGPQNGVATVPYVVWNTKEEALAKLVQAGLGTPEIEEAYDENVSEGQVISQSVSAGEKVEEGTVLTLTVSRGPAPFELDDVVGKSVTDAEELLLKRGLVVSLEFEKNDTVPANHVVSQSIEAGTSVRRGDAIVLVVSSEEATGTVPPVVGKTVSEARETLRALGFEVAVLENYDETVPQGIVADQTPRASTEQPEGATITLYVSKGKRPTQNNEQQAEPEDTRVSVPKLVGINANTAKAQLQALGLKFSTTYRYSDTVSEDGVLAQSISAGTKVKKGTSVILVVSRGKSTFSDWFTSLPENVTSDDYIIEEKTQYQYRTKSTETKTSSSSSYTMSGWTPDNTTWKWGSTYTSSSRLSISENRRESQPSTTTIVTPAHTLYYYFAWRGNFDTGAHFSEKAAKDRGATSLDKDELWLETKQTPVDYGPMQYGSDPACKDANGNNIYYYKYWCYDKKTNEWKRYYSTIDGMPTYVPAVTKTTYYYQDKIYTHNFYKWSDWSGWSDTAVTESSTRQVQTQTLYRWRER